MPPKVKEEPQPPKEPVAQPKSDSDVLIGGPGQPVEEIKEPATPSKVEVVVSGKKYLVDPDIAQAMKAREDEFNQKLNQNSQELGELRKLRREAPPPKEPTKEQGFDYETALFEKPREAVQHLKQEIRAEIVKEYVQDKAEERFWNDFYRKNPDLDRDQDDFMVKAVMQQHFSELAPMTPEAGRERLADLTRQQLLRLSQKARLNGEESHSTSRAVVESVSSPQEKAPKKEEQTPGSISKFVLDRRKARKEGRRPRTAA